MTNWVRESDFNQKITFNTSFSLQFHMVPSQSIEMCYNKWQMWICHWPTHRTTSHQYQYIDIVFADLFSNSTKQKQQWRRKKFIYSNQCFDLLIIQMLFDFMAHASLEDVVRFQSFSNVHCLVIFCKLFIICIYRLQICTNGERNEEDKSERKEEKKKKKNSEV